MDPEPLSKRVTSRKFWALNVTIAGSAWASWWMVKQLIMLRWGMPPDWAPQIGEQVFENLVGLVITTESIFAAFLVGLYMGVNVLQKVKLDRLPDGAGS